MNTPIAITSIASFSPLGCTTDEVWQNYLNPTTLINTIEANGATIFASSINNSQKNSVEELKASNPKFKSLDNSVIYAMLASRQAIKNANWNSGVFGVNIGSSRGATELFEKHHQQFLETGKVNPLASPTTTLGNISSWVAHDLKSCGPEISHSITCSTALHAVLNAVAWLNAGMATKFLIGGSEAPLTQFTFAQMKALKIYATDEQKYPCRAFDLEKTKNTMVLGEGAAVACLETGNPTNALAYITGIGFALDELEHNISITTEAECFQQSMKMAISNLDCKEVDAIVMHAPGTIKGDESEYKAIQKVFGTNMPMLTTNKWKIGHTFGASGMFSIELAVLMLQHQQFITVPFAEHQTKRKEIKNILVNAVGFGGNAVSILLSKK